MDFLDPYYNKALHKDTFGKEIDSKEYIEYKTKMISSTGYAIQAFHRIVLVWVKKLIKDKSYISYYDIRRDDIANELNYVPNASARNLSAKNKKNVAIIASGLIQEDQIDEFAMALIKGAYKYISKLDMTIAMYSITSEDQDKKSFDQFCNCLLYTSDAADD